MDTKKIQQLRHLVYAPAALGSNRKQLLLSAAFLASVNGSFCSDTIYIAEAPADLLQLPEDGRDFFLVCCFDETCVDVPALFAKGITVLFLGAGTSPSETLAVLKQALQRNHDIAQMSWELLRASSRNCSIQKLTEIAQQHIKNTIAVFGTGFQLIAFQGTPDPSAERWMQDRYLNHEDIERVNTDDIHERAKKSPVPLLVQNKHFKYDRIIAMLDHNRDLGHLVIIEDKVPFTELDYHIASILSDSIRQQMLKDEFTRNIQGFPHEYFLKDLLDQRLVNTPQNLNHTDFLHQRFSPDCCCLVVETARTSGALSINLIRNGFEQLAPGTSTVSYQGQIVVIFSGIPSQGISSEKMKQLREFCVENRLFCGMSNPFADILELPKYYKQSLRAIEIGAGIANEPNLFCYQDYFIKHLLNSFLQQEDAAVFCCPQMKQLMECDKKDGRNLAETLYRYLLNGNAAATASAMFIHRNTLLYRLNLINELVHIDYSDPALRLYLILSYEMMQTDASLHPSSPSVSESNTHQKTMPGSP